MHSHCDCPFCRSNYQANPGGGSDRTLRGLWRQYSASPTPQKRLQYLFAQLRATCPDISILTSEDTENPDVLEFIELYGHQLCFAGVSLDELLGRLHHVIANRVATGIQSGGGYNDRNLRDRLDEFEIFRLAWAPPTEWKEGRFTAVVRTPMTSADEEPFWYSFSISYILEPQLQFPYESCYICHQSADFSNFDGFIDSEFIARGPTPDYLAPFSADPEGYGLGPYSEMAAHYGITRRPIYQYSLHARKGNPAASVSFLGASGNPRYVGPEPATKILPDKVIDELGGLRHMRMPSIDGFLEQDSPFSPNKDFGYRLVYLSCGHRFPFFLWRLPDDVYFYPLWGRGRRELDSNLVKRDGQLAFRLI